LDSNGRGLHRHRNGADRFLVRPRYVPTRWLSPGLSRSEQLALPKVRYFLYGELYDLTLHLAMLAVALAGALIFMAVARRFLQPTGSRGARRLRNCPDRRLLWIQPASRSHPRWS
jgi:hypothetical protein